MINEDTLAAIRAACEAAPPELYYDEDIYCVNIGEHYGGYVIARMIPGILGQSNKAAHAVANLLCLARRHLLPLCDEVERLRAELARLEPRASTHYGGCWQAGPEHYECAVREIERLRPKEYLLDRYNVIDETGELPKCFGCRHVHSIMQRKSGAPCCECRNYSKFEEPAQ